MHLLAVQVMNRKFSKIATYELSLISKMLVDSEFIQSIVFAKKNP